MSIFFIDSINILVIISAIAVVFTFIAVYFEWFPSIHEGKRKSWGIFFFPLALLILLITCGKNYEWIAFTSMLILAFADSFAAIIGTFVKSPQFHFTSDKKTIAGSLAFFVVTTLLFYILSLGAFNFLSNDFQIIFKFDHYLISASIIFAVILTAFEAISSKGFDNFIVPLIAAILLFAFFHERNSELLYNFITGMALAGIVAALSYKVRFLTANGSVATFLLAGFIFGFGGWKWSVPILSFFILSSLLSKFRKKKNESVELYFEKSGVRDYMQVFANGGPGGILILINVFYPNDLFYLTYIATLSAVCADTWATEIGTLKRTVTYNITNMKPTEQGVSGGISIPGTIGALLGAVTISLSGIAWIQMNLIQYILITVFAGTLGSLFDSILGATIQEQNKCNVCSKVTERVHHCGKETSHFKGLTWLNNDLVNLLAGVFGGIIILVLAGL